MARTFVSASLQSVDRGSAAVTAFPWSISLWFKCVASVAAGQQLGGLGASLGTDQAVIVVSAANKVRYRLVATTALSIDTTAAFTDNVWSHACVVSASASDHRVFVNGGNKITDSTSKTPASLDSTSVGRGVTTIPVYFDGSVAEFGIWNIALSDAEVAALYVGGVPKRPWCVRREALVSYQQVLGAASPEPDGVSGVSAWTVSNAPAQETHPTLSECPRFVLH